MPGAAMGRGWERFQALAVEDGAVRSLVGASWRRSRDAGVSPSLARAPRAIAEDALEAVRRGMDWLGFTDRFARDSEAAGPGHIVSFFDAKARLVATAGDPRVRAIAEEANFAPGGLWAEDAVGTNGPGTSLATNSAVYIPGPEHFSEAWHGWHCAAIPLHEASTGEIVGVVDVSSNASVRGAQGHLLALVKTIAVGIELQMRNAALQRRVELTDAFFRVAHRYPNEQVVVVDRSGLIVAASPAAPPRYRAGQVLAAGDTGVEVEPLHARGSRLGGFILLPSARAGRTAARSPERRDRAATRYRLDDLLGQAPAMVEARRIVTAAASHALPVIVLGESGVGKEVAAQAIHAASARRTRPFVVVTGGALSPSLVESELFGYAAGAFTGGLRGGATGKFEEADGGTLFLDELAELPLAAQPALLRALQEGEITRIGESRPRRVDVRVVAATNRDLAEAMQSGRLRRDLYYRLAVIVCELPPLRDCRGDIDGLVEVFLDDACREVGRARFSLAPCALAVLRAHEWPGNVRELKNLIRRLAGTTRGSVLTAVDLPLELVSQGPSPPALGAAGEGRDEGEIDAARVRDALARTATVHEAARLLGIARSTLYRHLDRLGLRVSRTVRPSPLR